MNLLRKYISAAEVCLLSFFRRAMTLSKRVICTLCAAAILFSTLPLSVAAADDQGQDLREMSIELTPNDADPDVTITLNGMMPRNAAAEATDVTADMEDPADETSVLAAYDISIIDGGDAFQPAEGYPIFVEISDPALCDSGSLSIIHIADDGTREEVEHFTVEDGKVSFYATGFSIYEIVEINPGYAGGNQVTTVAELTDQDGATFGFNLYYGSPANYFTSAVNENNALVESTDAVQASVWFFEQEGNYLKLYTRVNGVKKYLHTKSGNEIELSETAADLLELTVYESSPRSFYIKKSNANRWLQHSGSGAGIRYYTSNTNATNSRIYIRYAMPEGIDVDALERLIEKPYGLFHYAQGSTVGNALMAQGDTHSLVKLVLTAEGNHRILYVDEDNEIDQWQFTYDPSDEKLTISVNTSSGTQYLCADSTGISTTSDPASASKFNAQVSSDHRIKLESNGYYVTYLPRAQDEGGSCFSVTTDSTDSFTWLYLLDRASLEDSDLITFSADRLSVSDIPNGQKVIVYMRVWNEEELRYDMYAVDRDGSLYPCYASGGKIMWLGDDTGSLEWEFTEYLDAVTKQPNYYYELYNPYSEKYLAPQLTGNQVLSENTIGINMPGRRNGGFYSEIVAWDNGRYAYIGLRPNADKTALESCSESTSLPFYFATLEELNLSDRLHEVPTLDNNQHGIKMKMVNFDLKSGQAYGTEYGSEFTWDYLNGKSGGSVAALKTGLLSSSLDANGYPIATPTGLNISPAFNNENARKVNHLFLERVYESSGYFEFDSTQNFATLKHKDDNGDIVWNSGENGETDFIMYHELGTHDARSTANSLKHGQFFPYDTIEPGVYSVHNPQNLFSSLTVPNVESDQGKLPESDPRKYEQLHLIHTEKVTEKGKPADADFYFGMEMEASFVQTPSGLDAWGHDIVFEFTGDDDFWLYVDGQLVIDLGGTHSAVMGTINFRTGVVKYDVGKVHDEMAETTLRDIFTNNYIEQHPGVTQAEIDEYLSGYFNEGENIFKDYSTHTMKVFYMERGANASNLHMRFNIASVTPGHVVVSKSVSGEGADMLDTDFLEYPFQIFYTLPEGPNNEPGEEHLLGNDDEHIAVTYQNSNQPVNFVRLYRPPGFTEAQAYENIYFINPSKSAEIAFPDNTITYRIVECAVDSSVYGNVTINGEEVPSDRIEIRGDLRSYSSEVGTAELRPSISFDNHVNEDVIKDLFVTKKLLDENNNEITDDPATFNFRLSLSSVDVPADQIPLANMYHYFVLDSDKKMCRYDSEQSTFVATELTYSRNIVAALKDGPVQGYTIDDVQFTTSGFGSISGIPATYTICVPGLPVGTVFKVTEDVKTGYGLMGYERVMGTKILEDLTEEDIPSYMEYQGNPLNIGKVIAEENPQMEVHNKKGYGLAVKKQWSDLSLTTGHESVYVAVYIRENGQLRLLDGTVKRIQSPSTSADYFWTTLEPYANGSPRESLDDYVVREVTLSNPNPTVSADGTVTDYGTLTPLDNGDRISLTATRTTSATPEGENPDKAYDYIVSYQRGTADGTTRVDTVTNTREGGLAIRLFKWDTAIPLSGGHFTLTNSSGNTVGTYVSGSDGTVTMMYEFDRNETYTLVQTAAPRGYVGLQKPLCFTVNNDDTVSLFYEDGTAWGSQDITDLRWANDKPGDRGLIAYVDVYNKPFNFKIAKMDSEDTAVALDNAHFALYKQTNTTIGGLEKNRDPMTGFEDMVTANGEVYICGGDSGRSINPGANGSVYFLTETQAPMTYTKLEDDIIFRISAIGIPSLISDSYNGQLVETEDSYIYTLSVPNVRVVSDNKLLMIRKIVSGNLGDYNQEFTFTLTVDSAAPGDTFAWMKNSVLQSAPLHSGDTFTLKHEDEVIIAVPKEVNLTVSEQNLEYITTFRLDDAQPETTNTLTFSIADDATLEVVNNLGFIIPTGVTDSILAPLLCALVPLAIIAFLLWRKRASHANEN